MTIRLGSNVSALTAQRKLADGTAALAKTFERLSSGQRINRASDDAAGLSIADSLNARSRIYNQGVRNLNDGLSLLSIADSAIETLSGIMIRLEELAEQAANGVYTNKQRKAMDDEAQALSKEFFRISKTTTFNGQNLLSGEFGSVNLQGGIGSDAVLSAGVGGAIGTGSFEAGITYDADERRAHDLALADINGDGHIDLLSAGIDDISLNSGTLTVRLGTGTGAFGPAKSFLTEAVRSYGLALGDLNGDGSMDVVTAGNDGANGYATVLLGDGAGSFSSGVSYATEGSSSIDVTLADLNHDGHLDLITTGNDAVAGYSTIRLGDGTGSFGAATTYAAEGAFSFKLEVGDLNEDGNLDLVTVGNDGLTGYATVRFGDGSGSFNVAVTHQTGTLGSATTESGLALADLNSDGHLDLVVSGEDGSNNGFVGIRLGDGTGSFGAATTYATESLRSVFVTTADLNGDGFLDLLTSGRSDSSDGEINFRLGVGNGTFSQAVSFVGIDKQTDALALGDFNSDGVPDLVTSGQSDTNLGYTSTHIGRTKPGVAPILPFSLSTLADARQALPVFRRKREQLTMQRGEIGAFQSRTEVAINVLQVSSENFKAAESRIRDADIAEESSRLVRLNILQQAASSILAQANQQPAIALRLMGGA